MDVTFELIEEALNRGDITELKSLFDRTNFEIMLSQATTRQAAILRRFWYKTPMKGDKGWKLLEDRVLGLERKDMRTTEQRQEAEAMFKILLQS